MVRNASRKLKFGVQSHFYPISTVGFRTFSPENFGQAYWSVAKVIVSLIRKMPRHKKQSQAMTMRTVL